MYYGSWKINDNLTFVANTHNPTNGSATDSDSVPSYHVYEDETAAPLITGTMALLNGANTVGFYSEQIALTAANGFEKGKSYNIYIQTVVNSITGTTARSFQIEAEVDANIVSDKTGYTLSSPQAFDLNGNITGTFTGNILGSVQSVTNPVGINTGTFLEALADKVWDEALSGHLTVGSAGYTLFSRMPTGTVLVGDKTGFSLVSPQSFDLIGNISGTITNVLNVVNPVVAGVVTGSVLGNVNGSVNSVTQPVGILTGSFINAIADQVWDESLAGHLSAGSAGNALNAAGAAGDPWSTLLPGSYTSGQAGHILASRMPTGTVLVGDKTGFSLSSPQVYDRIGNTSGTITTVLNVTNPVTVGTNNDKTGYGLATGTLLDAIADKVWDETNSEHLINGSVGYTLFSRMPSGTVLVGDKTGFSLSSPQAFNLIGNISGTLSNVINVINPVVAGVVTGSVLGNVNGSVGSVVSPVGINTGTFLGALADAVWDEAIAGHLSAGSVGNALNAAGSAGDPWSTLLPGSYTVGQAGHILASRMPTGTVLVGDKTGFSLSSPQAFDLVGNVSGTLTNVLNVVNPVIAGVVTGSVLGNVNGSVASVTNPVGLNTGTFIGAIADGVWDEAIAGHLSAGSTGEKLNSAGSAGDPWGTALPGAYTAGTAGHILASRMPTGTVIVGTNQDKTGYSLSSPQTINIIGNITGTFVGNIQGNVTGSVGEVVAIAAALCNKIADHVLRRSYASARASSDGDAVTFRSLLGAIAKLVNKWSISGTTLTVKHEDDTTTFQTQTLTGTPGADPITQVDTD